VYKALLFKEQTEISVIDIYIYIYMCVCVCVCVFLILAETGSNIQCTLKHCVKVLLRFEVVFI